MLNVSQIKEPQLQLLQLKSINMETARKLTGLCYSTFYAKAKDFKLRHLRLGTKLYFSRETIIEFIKAHKAGDWSMIDNEREILESEKCDLKDFARITESNYQTLYSMVKQKQIPRFRYGRKIIISIPIMKTYIKVMENGEW